MSLPQIDEETLTSVRTIGLNPEFLSEFVRKKGLQNHKIIYEDRYRDDEKIGKKKSSSQNPLYTLKPVCPFTK